MALEHDETSKATALLINLGIWRKWGDKDEKAFIVASVTDSITPGRVHPLHSGNWGSIPGTSAGPQPVRSESSVITGPGISPGQCQVWLQDQKKFF